jgi:hypothetical protein
MFRYILSFISILIGALLVIKTDWFLKVLGRIEWAERHLGTEGGSRLFYKLLGLLIIIIGFMIMTGAFQALLVKTLSPLFRGIY